MKITEYMEQTDIIPPTDSFNDISLYLMNALDRGNFPTITPFPQEMNAVTRTSISGLNGTRIELAAYAYGFDRAVWITGPDAASLGLQLNPETVDPVTVIQNFTGSAYSIIPLYEHAYLIDQFTEESLKNMYSLATLAASSAEELSPENKAKSVLAQKVVRGLAQYDSGDGMDDKYRNYSRNIGTNYIGLSMNANKAIKSSLRQTSVPAFNYFSKYFLQQYTGRTMGLDKNTGDKKIKASFSSLTTTPEEAIKTFSYAKAFADGMIKPEFGMDIPVPFTTENSVFRARNSTKSPYQKNTVLEGAAR